MILGFDPGRDKCGLAVMDRDRKIYTHAVIGSEKAIEAIQSLCQQYKIDQIVIGNQTTSKSWLNQLTQAFISSPIPITPIDERNSTLQARDRYWQIYPPQGLTRLSPQGMRVPPRPVDDIVAIILIERFLQQP